MLLYGIIEILEGHRSWVESVALASGSDDKTIKIWDTASWRCVETLEGHNGSANSVAFSPDGQRLASGSMDKTVKI